MNVSKQTVVLSIRVSVELDEKLTRLMLDRKYKTKNALVKQIFRDYLDEQADVAGSRKNTVVTLRSIVEDATRSINRATLQLLCIVIVLLCDIVVGIRKSRGESVSGAEVLKSAIERASHIYVGMLRQYPHIGVSPEGER